MIYIGTAGWNIPARLKTTREKSQLEIYSENLNGVEINSSFYRDHRRDTYERWAASTSKNFRFSVKLSRTFTHHNLLKNSGQELKDTLDGISGLGKKWSALLVQLPPKLKFEKRTANQFFEKLRKLYSGQIALEPRNISWASKSALKLFDELDITKVEADPERCPTPVRTNRPRYIRWHGQEIYRSRYSLEQIESLGADLAKGTEPTWCVFDNTMFGFAFENAIELSTEIKNRSIRIPKGAQDGRPVVSYSQR